MSTFKPLPASRCRPSRTNAPRPRRRRWPTATAAIASSASTARSRSRSTPAPAACAATQTDLDERDKGDTVAGTFGRGIDEVADRAVKLVDYGTDTAATQVAKMADMAAGVDNTLLANGLFTAARITLPGAKVALAVSDDQVARGAVRRSRRGRRRGSRAGAPRRRRCAEARASCREGSRGVCEAGRAPRPQGGRGGCRGGAGRRRCRAACGRRRRPRRSKAGRLSATRRRTRARRWPGPFFFLRLRAGPAFWRWATRRTSSQRRPCRKQARADCASDRPASSDGLHFWQPDCETCATEQMQSRRSLNMSLADLEDSAPDSPP
ncbi:MAG: hypothetical protein MZW92_57055 [Comamonadaceae bacterium]|nr:hypothetical protein [Comamonadaceae bacterium]